ncbi:MAG: molybdopterin-dependent oxidoreductase [candidate division WOR-3 bacterium]
MRYSVCVRDCYDTCFLKSDFTDGKLKLYPREDHPLTAGFLCRKGLRMAEWAFSKERLTSPLFNTSKGVGNFQEISISEALNVFKQKIEEISSKWGSEKILVFEFAGNRGIISRFFPFRFFNKINASFVKYNLCDSGGAEALTDVYGLPVGLSPEDVRDSNLIVYWGLNAVKTNLHGFNYFRRKGFKIAAIDIRESETVRLADFSLKVLPGADVFLALLLAKIMVEDGFYDEKFVRANSCGFDEFISYLRGLDYQILCENSGVSLEKARSFARMFYQYRGVIHIGYGFQRSLEGPQAVAFISYLPLLVGHLPGFIYDMNVGLDKEYVKALHLRTEPPNFIYQSELSEAIEKGKVKFLFIYNSNPMATNPNINRLKKALLENDVFVVLHDLFLTDTAYYADLIFPAKTSFEHLDIVDSYYHKYVGINEKIFEYAGYSNYELAKLLAEVFGFQDKELFESEESIIKYLLESKGVRFEEIMEKGFVRIERKFSLKTPSGKVEFMSSRRKERGLVDFPYLSTLRIPQGNEQFKFRLISVTFGDTISSQYTNIFSSRIDKRIYLNSEDAKRLGLKGGDKVRVYNQYGEIITDLGIDDTLPLGVALMYKAFWKRIAGFSVNELTTDEVVKEFGCQTAYHSTMVNIEGIFEDSLG